MGTKGIHFAAILLIVVVVVAILGCAAPATTTKTPAATTTTTPAAPAKELTIGMVCPITGPTASWGAQFKAAHEIAFEKINGEGGVQVGSDKYKLKLIVYDHKAQGTEAVAAINKLVYQDGVKFVASHSSAPTLAMLPICTQNKVMQVSSGYARLIGAEYPYAFRGEYSGKEAGEGLYGYLVTNNKTIKTVSGISNDTDTGKNGLKASLSNAGAFGLTVLSEQYVPNGTTDFYPAISKMLADNPNLIDLDAMAPADKAVFVKQVREKGYKGPMLGTDQTDIKLLMDVAGAASVEGYMQEGLDFNGTSATAEQKWFYDQYIKKYGPPFESNAGKYYNFPIVFAQGIAFAKSVDPVVVAEKLPDATLNVLGVEMKFGGLKRYGVKHQVACPVYVSQVQAGKLITLGKFIPEVP